jgi:hypothetical protein
MSVTTTEVPNHERTPREEIVVQLIGLGAILVIAVMAPMVERVMSDPDIAYRCRWHLKRLERLAKLRIHELNVATETAVGIYLIEQHLRANWKKDHEHTD